jgi:transcriptional regulator with XRE-family HTH domain
VRHWRLKRGISLSELGRRIPAGERHLTHSAVWQWENGKSRPTDVAAIAVALGCDSMAEFYGAESDLPPEEPDEEGGAPTAANG